MIILKDYQRRAVDDLKGKLINLLNQEGASRQKLVFKAPTGSGKTVMASALLDEVTREIADSGTCIYTRVAWVWIAPNKLHQQSYRSMRNYFSETRSLRPLFFDECDHVEGLKRGDVLFLNWESVNKDNAVMIRDNEQNRTLYELLRRTQIIDHVPIVVVIDEEHMFGGRNAVKSEKLLANIKPMVELRISATPITPSFQAVEVLRSAVVAEEMIKKGVQLNPNVKGSREQQSLTVNQQLLEKALNKRNELAKAYAEHGINPLLLIQLPNDKDSMSAEDRNIAEELKTYLETRCDISAENGRLAVWLSKEKTPNLADITRPDDMTQVLLFKQAIALGWDCPRAAVLLIFRELQSMTFTTQTVGRILRMPEQRFYSDDRLNYGYVYTNLSADIISIVGDDMNYLSTVFANLRPDIAGISLPSVYQDKNGKERNRLGAGFRQVLCDVMKEFWGLTPLTLFSEELFFEDDDMVLTAPRTDGLEERIVINRNNARKHGVQTDVARIMIEIPKDTRLPGDGGMVKIVDRARFALNASELNALFTMFCRRNVGSYSKFDSTPVLRGALEYALEDFLGVFSTEAPKVVLYHRNRPHFEDLISRALTRYELTQKKSGGGDKRAEYKHFTWQLPATRIYNSAQVVSQGDKVFNHALRPFFEKRLVSKPEYHFARWIDAQTEAVEWWYKNGDEGKQHFAIAYTDSGGRRRCFYVDFIVLLKNGTICLFDTKTPGSDPDGVEKNNALYDYVTRLRSNGVKITGGLLIGRNDFTNWYYPDGFISTMDTTDGWTQLNLNRL